MWPRSVTMSLITLYAIIPSLAVKLYYNRNSTTDTVEKGRVYIIENCNTSILIVESMATLWIVALIFLV